MEKKLDVVMLMEEYQKYLVYNEKSKSTINKYLRDAGKYL